MAEKDGPNLAGRFIKRNDPILDLVKVTEFNLSEVTIHKSVIPDNMANSIIHANLHLRTEIQESTKPYLFTDNDITPEGSRRPVIVPIDFTEDWQRMRARSSKKEIYMDDEDYFFFEAANRSAKFGGGRSDDENDTDEEEQTEKENPDAGESNSGSAPSDPMAASPVAKEFKILDEVSAQIPKNQDQLTGSGLVLKRNDASPAESMRPQASENPRNEVEVDQGVIEEMMQRGYEDGYKHALEQAQTEIAADAEKRSSQLADLIDHLEKLKKDILVNAQDNFRAICQTLMESLLQKEFHLNPDAFGSVIQRAVDEAVGDDKFKIRVNPSQVDKLSNFSGEKLKDHIVADETIEPGDFAIDSSHGVIDGKLRKLVSDLLNQADMQLISPDEVAS